MTIERRSRISLPTGPRAFGVVAAAAGAMLLGLGAGMTFFSDEWAFIELRSLGDPVDWLRPHNEHWSTLPIILYRLMVETIGIGSYVPYLAAVIALHLVVAAFVYRLLRRRTGPTPAFVGGVLVLLFGAGFENLYWGFQTGFVGSMALGLAALDLTDGPATTRRATIAAAFLLLSLMSSGTGLVVSVAVGVTWLLEPRWRRLVPWLAIPAASYAAWYLAFGRAGVTFMRNPFTLDAASDVPAFVVRGLGNAGGAIAGVGPLIGIAVAAAIVAWAAARAWRRTLRPVVPGLLAAIVVQYGLIGLVRGNVFPDQVNYTRYTYVSGILLLVAVGALAGRLSWPAPGRLRPVLIVAALSVTVLAFAYNIQLLVGGRELFLERADMTRALVTAGLERPLPVETDPERSLVLIPSPAALERIVGTRGDPSTDVLVPWAVRPIPPDVMAEARRRVREGAPIPLPEG